MQGDLYRVYGALPSVVYKRSYHRWILWSPPRLPTTASYPCGDAAQNQRLHSTDSGMNPRCSLGVEAAPTSSLHHKPGHFGMC